MAALRVSRMLFVVWIAVQMISLPALSFSTNRRNSIRRIGSDQSPCPDRCRCKPRAVYCDGIRMEAVPRRLPRNLATLRIKDTQIRSLQYDSFRRMFDLRHLIVTGNKVSHVEPTAFKDLYSLISLSLSQNELEWLSEDTFKHQLLLKELSLSRNRLKDVALVLSYLENVQVLNLAENQLEEITDRTFQGNVAVRILDLHGNRLHFIHRRAFRRLAALTFLILRDNPLMEVYVQFRANHQLEQLDITRCQLTSVMKDTPPGLRDLRLSENSIAHVESEDFQNPTSIQLLVLSHNELDVLSDTALMEMVELYDLHLTQNRLSQLPNTLPDSLHGLYASFNRITQIGDKCFSAQQLLNSLVLSHNRISDIDPKAMNNLKRLVSLDLSYNDIRVLRTAVFKRLYSLQRLDLSNNPLFQLEPRSFAGLENLHILKMSSVEGSDQMKTSALADLPNLLFLDISNSSRIVHGLLSRDEYSVQAIDTVEDLNAMNSGLRALPSNIRLTLSYLRIVKLTGNPWHCDTNIGWMSQWMRSGDVEFFEPEKMICSSPPRLKGRRLLELSWNDFAKATIPPYVAPVRPTDRRRQNSSASTKLTVRTTALPTTETLTNPTTTTRTIDPQTDDTTTTTTTTTSTTTPTTTTTTTTTTTVTSTPTTTTAKTTTVGEITLFTTKTTATSTTPSTTTTKQPITYSSTQGRGGGVFLQFKRVRQKEDNASTTGTIPPSTLQYHPPPPPLPSGSRSSSSGTSDLPSAEYLAFRYPRYSLFRSTDSDYMNDEESSTPDENETSFLPVSHYYNAGDGNNEETVEKDDKKRPELDKYDIQKEELIKITEN